MKKSTISKWLYLTVTFAVFMCISVSANAALVDLSTWKAEGDGTWNLQSGNNAVLQTKNGAPTIFYNNQNSQGSKLSGKIRVTTNSDDDFIGFVLGYHQGDLNKSNVDYLLIDWKKRNQQWFEVEAKAGLAISRVTDKLQDNEGAWGHVSSYGVTELQRGTTLGNTGWEQNKEYNFDITFTSNKVEVFVNSNLELSISGTFQDGSFGFYNYSQPDVLYSAIDESTLPPVPLPGAVWLFGSGLSALLLGKKGKAFLINNK